MQCEKKDGSIILRPSLTATIIIGVFSLLMVCAGIYILYSLFMPEDGSFSASDLESVDWFGVCFIILWLSIICWGAYVGFFSKIRHRIIVDHRGVHEQGVPFRRQQRELCWSEIRDYGYFFAGNHKTNGRSMGIHTLYFSPEPLQSRGTYRKKRNKEMIALDIDQDSLSEIADLTVFPYCRQYRSFEPNTVPLKDHIM